MEQTTASIPIINISPSNPNAPQELLSAASTYGFIFIENDSQTGIPPSEIANIFTLSKLFFAAPLAEKQTVAIASNKAGKNLGWLSRGIEKLDPETQKRADVKEAFNICPPSSHTGTLDDQPLPPTLQPHSQAITTFQTRCHALCQLLLSHLATALQIPDDWFTSRHDQTLGPSGTVFRMLYYPALPDKDGGDEDLRAGAHSDFGSLTLLFQLPGQPGLEIQTPSGAWASVPVDPSRGESEMEMEEEREEGSTGAPSKPLPILVNIGDLLEDWTSGLLKSTRHRVVFPSSQDHQTQQQDRYSLAYFCHPLDEALLEPVPSSAVQEHAARTKANATTTRSRAGMTARDHLMERLGATYSLGK